MPLSALGGFTWWATQTITVGATDIPDLTIAVRAGFRLSGQAEFSGVKAAPSPDLVRRMSATLDPADGRPLVSSTMGRGQFDDGGRLSTYELPPGRYYLRINNPPLGWALKGAIVSGRDISNVPVMLDRDVTGVVISFTDRPSSLAGQVSALSGAPDGSATVLVFPSDPAAWTDTGDFPRRLQAIRVDRNGSYRIVGLAPGEYFAIAIPEEASANWQDPSALKSMATLATRFAIADGESRTLSLRTTVQR
jgi:hypothetical protein